jgi:hypothetical protein
MNRRRPQLILLAFAALVAAVYLALPTRSYYWDGIGFALGIEHPEWFGTSLIEPNHLLYIPFGRALYVMAQQTGLGIRSMTALQAANGISAACCVFVLGSAVLDWTGSIFMSLLSSALLAFSATWWKFSTDADAYVMAALFLMLAFRFILPWQPLRPLSVAALHSAAMLFHELSFLFCPAAILGLWMQAQGRLRQWLAVSTYICAAFVMTMAPYVFSASRANIFSPRRFVEWLAYHTPDSHFSVDAANVAAVAEGHVKLLLGGRWTLARRFQGVPTAVALALLALFIILIVRRPSLTPDDAAPGWRETRAMLILSLAWISPFFVFLCFWLPGNTFYRLLYAPALMLLLAATAVQRGWLSTPARRRAIAIGVASVCAWNFSLLIWPESRTEANPVLLAAEELQPRLASGAMIYHATFPPDDWLVMYLNPQTRWMELTSFNPLSVQHDVAEAAEQGRPVWLDGSALERLDQEPGGPAWLNRHIVDRFELHRAGHDIRFAQVHP